MARAFINVSGVATNATLHTQGNTASVYSPQDASFVSGVTMPAYEITSDFSGAKNVGNLPGVAQTLYQGSQGNGSVMLASGTYTNIDFGNRALDIRGDVVLNNCRGVLTNNSISTSIGAQVWLLNGTTSNSLVMNDCEFHNRDQRIMTGFMGRNFIINRCVFTGHYDGVDNANSGGAPQNTPGEVNDSWIGDHSWWYYPTAGVVHTSDTQSHNDSSQVQIPGISWNNVFFATWPSEYVGTGTPGCGSDAGNTHTYQYITDQSTMESWRDTYLNKQTRADQSFDGVSRKSSTGGSWAGIMGNSGGGSTLNLQVTHCWFSGGGVQMNLSDTTLTGQVATIKQCTFWNDMSLGHSLTTTAKGVAVYVRSGLTLTMPTSGPDANHWFDGSIVSPSYVT